MFSVIYYCNDELFPTCTYRSDLDRNYRTKMSEMELKRAEIFRMNQEYEAKMRQKEVFIHITFTLILTGKIYLTSIYQYMIFRNIHLLYNEGLQSLHNVYMYTTKNKQN